MFSEKHCQISSIQENVKKSHPEKNRKPSKQSQEGRRCFISRLHTFLKMLVKMPVYFYRLFISPFLGMNCRFLPSCSQYALEAIEIHGIWYGCSLTLKRISRCHPWGKHGIDDVPPSSHHQL